MSRTDHRAIEQPANTLSLSTCVSRDTGRNLTISCFARYRESGAEAARGVAVAAHREYVGTRCAFCFL